MRKLSRLYEILLDYRYYSFKQYRLGICYQVNKIFLASLISTEEKQLLEKDLEESLPQGTLTYNWKVGSRFDRNRFIKKRIKQLLVLENELN